MNAGDERGALIPQHLSTCHIDDRISSGSHRKLSGKEMQMLEIGQMCAKVVRVREHGEGPKGGYYRNTSYKKAPQRQG